MKRILVIGESCRDVFVYCEAKRLCPDIPVPVLNEVDRVETGGMAKNVHRNILSLHKHCDIITNKNWSDITKTRYVHTGTNHTFFRVDSSHNTEPITISEISYDYDIVVISDYNKGFLSEDDIKKICSKHSLVFLDTKKVLGPWANDAAYIKINDYEYNNSKQYIDSALRDKVIHTHGEHGCIFREKKYPVKKVEVRDTSGAGDSFISGLVVDYLKTNDIEKSIMFANKCASTVVTKKGVAVI